MEHTSRKSTAPFYAVGLLWLVCGLLLPLYAPLHYILLAAVSVAVFWGVDTLCRSAEPIGAKTVPISKAEKPEDPTTGNAELDKLLKDGQLAIAEMKRLDDNIADPGISADIVRLEQISQSIFEEVKRNPKKLPQLRRFMDYYLPTTLKLLNSYDRMSDAGISGQNIGTTLSKVEGIMRTIVAAFEKQLDNLYGTDALDISTDITVLETMLAREGLTDPQMKADTPPSNHADIQLEL